MQDIYNQSISKSSGSTKSMLQQQKIDWNAQYPQCMDRGNCDDKSKIDLSDTNLQFLPGIKDTNLRNVACSAIDVDVCNKYQTLENQGKVVGDINSDQVCNFSNVPTSQGGGGGGGGSTGSGSGSNNKLPIIIGSSVGVIILIILIILLLLFKSR
jgi:hypothetical protein